MRIIGTASVMRHGATHYTGVFPDLADEGLPRVKATANEIARRFPLRPVFIASPEPRAISTALHVMEACGFPGRREDVLVEKTLGPISIFDREPVLALVERVVGHLEGDPLEYHRVWDHFFMRSPDFEGGSFCESRSSAERRCVEFLKRLPSFCGTDRHVVAVTHIELVGGVVHGWFGMDGDCFGPAEAVHLTFLDGGQFRAEFRGGEKILRL